MSSLMLPTFSSKMQMDLVLDKNDGSSMVSDGAKTSTVFPRNQTTEPIIANVGNRLTLSSDGIIDENMNLVNSSE